MKYWLHSNFVLTSRSEATCVSVCVQPTSQSRMYPNLHLILFCHTIILSQTQHLLQIQCSMYWCFIFKHLIRIFATFSRGEGYGSLYVKESVKINMDWILYRCFCFVVVFFLRGWRGKKQRKAIKKVISDLL